MRYMNAKSLGVLKNYHDRFNECRHIDENIEKNRKKAGMIFSFDFDGHKTNPLIYIKLWI